MPKFGPMVHHRRSIRLAGYDYCVGGFVPPTRYGAGTKPAALQAGAYYVTIVTWHREFLLGKIVYGEMNLNRYEKIAEECWQAIPEHFPNVELGAYIVMPNHVHGIIIINDIDVGVRHASPLRAHPREISPRSLGAIVGSFKSAGTNRIGRELNETGIWQRNYHEHIIRGTPTVLTDTSPKFLGIWGRLGGGH